jgi:branched-subunit amino acid aminotransferase/4-amino-4-deoxychorismate lyase
VLSPGDITPENIRRFFDSSKIQRFKTVPTAREIDVILRNTVRRFHSDRFSAKRPVVWTIRDPADRNAAIEAAEIVTKTVIPLMHSGHA